MRLSACLGVVFATLLVTPAAAEITLCTQITSIPFTINSTGTYCLKSDLASASTSGAMITINANNVVLDMNDFKLGGVSAGPTTTAVGIRSNGRTNITIRNGTIRGFHTAIHLQNAETDQSAHFVHNLRLDNIRMYAVYIDGGIGSIVRSNRITNTGTATASHPIGIRVENAKSVQVTDNSISTVVSSTGTSPTGLYVATSTLIEISRNMISNLIGGTSMRAVVGIEAEHTVIRDNILINYGPGKPVDIINSAGVACINNEAVSFSGTIEGCTISFGNNEL